MEKKPWKLLQRLNQLKGLKFLGRGAKVSIQTSKLFESISQIRTRFALRITQKIVFESWIMYLMGIFIDANQTQLKDVGVRFNLKKIDRMKFLEIKAMSGVLRKLAVRKLSPSQVFKILKPFSYEMILLMNARTKKLTVKKRLENFILKYDLVRLEINGNDLLQLGFVAGMKVGVILDQLLCRKIDGNIQSRQDELDYAARLLR